MEVAGEGGKTALAAGRKESQDLWLSPLGEGIPGSWTGGRLRTWLAVACTAPGGRPGMAHLLPRWHWYLQFLSLCSSRSPPQGPGAALAAPKPGGKPSDALAVWSVKGSLVSLP